MPELSDFYRGDTKIIRYVIKRDGTPIDIAGSTTTMTFKQRETDEDPGVIQKQGVITDAPNGEGTITLTSTDTDVEARKYWFDIQFVDSSGNVSTLLKGEVNIIQDITQTVP